jgi:hypothetical protein
MMRKLSKVPLLGLACLAVSADAYADVTFHGYGQVIMGTTFSNNRTFPPQSESSGYHADPTFTPNSNFALQASAPLGDDISATTQILARGDDDFQPKFQWAFLKYQFNQSFALKAGRLQLPFFQYSDYLFVGEAYPWIVPPESVYSVEVTHFDGLNFSAEKSIGDWFLFMQAVYGAYDSTLPVTNQGSTYTVITSSHNITGISLDSTYNDWLSLRAGAFLFPNFTIHSDGSAANPFTQADGFIKSLASQGHTETAKALDTSNDPVIYYNTAAQINHGNLVLIAEYEGIQSIAGASGIIEPQIQSEYISLGYHFGKLEPLATFGHRNEWIRANKMKSAAAADGIAINPIIDLFASTPGLRLKDYFYELGLRYDLTPTVALKLDYTFYQTHYKTSDYSAAGANPPDCNRLLAAITFSF